MTDRFRGGEPIRPRQGVAGAPRSAINCLPYSRRQKSYCRSKGSANRFAILATRRSGQKWIKKGNSRRNQRVGMKTLRGGQRRRGDNERRCYAPRKGTNVPHFPISEASRFNGPVHYPWSMGTIVSYETEGTIYGKYILQSVKDAKIGVLYQNDDLGRGLLQRTSRGVWRAGQSRNRKGGLVRTHRSNYLIRRSST